MKSFRELSSREKAVIGALVMAKPETGHYVHDLDTLVASGMDDGGMGSLLLGPKGVEIDSRSFGKQIVSGEFADTDGTMVSVALNTDSEGRLFELDFWKVDFSPLLCWPEPSAIRIRG